MQLVESFEVILLRPGKSRAANELDQARRS
jgi:hypothetical protein